MSPSANGTTHGGPHRGALLAALKYLDCGFNVLPITPGSYEPLIRWKAYQTTRVTHHEVRDWWRRWPSAGVALVCGHISTLVVLDYDPRNGPGLEELAYGACPTVATPGGGHHRYFSYSPIVRSTHPLVPGLDVQSDKTYVIAPPSWRHDKTYTFVNGTARFLEHLPLLPAAIVERLRTHHAYTANGSGTATVSRTLPTNGSAHHVDLDTALRILEEVHGVRIKKTGPLQWMASCPLHDDRKASLALSAGEGGRLLLNCHAGCAFVDLVEHIAAAAVSA